MTAVAVLGAGSWGVALAQLCASNGHRTILWARRAGAAAEIAETRTSAYLPGIVLDRRIEATAVPAEIAGACVVLSVIPVQATRQTLITLAPHIGMEATIVLCSKGVERETLALPAQIAGDALPGRSIAVLSGPSFAIDVVRGLPTAVTIAAEALETARRLQKIFATQSFRPYPTADLTGAQIGGALKNVFAIGCGIVTARGLGESARAALIARGYAEMTRLAIAMGARAETLSGLSGLGDLVLTCGSERSRNFSEGLRIGDPAMIRTAKGISEGAHTAEAAVKLGQRHRVALPICETVSDVLASRIDVDAGIVRLLSRPLRTRE